MANTADSNITAEPRTEFGKGAARRIRRSDKVPAVIYGHGNDPIHVSLPGHDTMLAIKHGGANAVLNIEIEGKVQLALTKQVQADPIKGFLEHIDFVAVRKGEKVTVEVPVHVVGEAARETFVQLEYNVVTVEAEEGRLVCRDRWGAALVTFSNAEVVAFADHLRFNEGFLSERREHRDSRDGRRRES